MRGHWNVGVGVHEDSTVEVELKNVRQTEDGRWVLLLDPRDARRLGDMITRGAAKAEAGLAAQQRGAAI